MSNVIEFLSLFTDRVLNLDVLGFTFVLFFSLDADLILKLIDLVLFLLDRGLEACLLFFDFTDLLLQLFNGFLALVDAVVDLAGLFFGLHVNLTELVLLFTHSFTVLDLVFKEDL